MAIRHKMRTLKNNANDMVESWNLYTQLFNTLISGAEITMCSLWISDILQEFVYQFQGFCQYRSLGNHKAEEVTILEANRSVWDFGVVVKILRDLVAAGSSAGANSTLPEFRKFALVELARLECLTGEFAASLKTLSPNSLSENMESITRIPLANANIYYHAGVCLLMLRQYAACIELLSGYLLNAQAFRSTSTTTTPATKGSSGQNQVQKTQDRCMGLIALAMTLWPYCRMDDQVKEAVETKYAEKIKRVSTSDSGLRELFESCCPKFICTVVPAVFNSGENQNQLTFDRIVASFVDGAKESMQSLKVLKYLRLYSSIDIAKLSKYCGCQEAETLRYLEIIKGNSSSGADNRHLCEGAKLFELQYQWQANTRIDYTIDGNILRSSVASSRAIRGSNIQSLYVSSLKKQSDLVNNITRAFAVQGL
jgi:translation initiation factor 3 subunit L